MARWLLLLIFLSTFPSPLQATMVLPLTTNQMADQSERIFVGRCLGVASELDEYQIPSTYVRLEVIRDVKGTEPGEQILIKQFGTDRKPLDVREGESAIVPTKTFSLPGRSFEIGREYLLYLYPESSLGFTSPVGGGQGKLEVDHE